MGGAAPGVPILQQQFDNGLTLSVQIAWGATFSSSASSGWTWADVSTDVQVDGGKHITVSTGRQDERSVAGPAQCTLTLDNRANLYSTSPFSVNWPNVKRGVPLRVLATVGGVTTTLFFGYVASFTPTFDTTGAYSVTSVTANGLFRRLSQGNAPIQSALRQGIPTALPNVTAYWPMEDSAGATVFASTVAGVPPLGFTIGTVTLANASPVVASGPLPTFLGAAGAFSSALPYVTSGAWQIQAVVSVPTGGLTDSTVLYTVYTDQGITRWDLVYRTGGKLQVLGYAIGTLLCNTGTFTISNLDNSPQVVRMAVEQNGGSAKVTVQVLSPDFTVSAAYTQTFAAIGTGVALWVSLLINGTINPVVMGHLVVQSAYSPITEVDFPFSAYAAFGSRNRIDSMLAIAGAEGSTALPSSEDTRMGLQYVDTLMNVIRECETTNVAYLIDGLTSSLTYVRRDAVENKPAALTLDATTGAIAAPYRPVDDDQLQRNTWTVTQHNGSSVTAADSTGPLGTAAVGVYSDSEMVNVYNNNVFGPLGGAFGVKAMSDRASWLVHRDTAEGYRVPTLGIAFHRNPELVITWLRTIQTVGMGRIDVTNLASVYPQLPPEPLSLLAVGYTHTIDKFTWRVDVNCAPYDVHRTGVIAAATGDTGEFLIRLETGGSALGAAVAVGASSMTVTTSTGPVWTTNSDDFPLSISVGGIRVAVTNVTGPTSPQTFTVDPATVTKDLPNGSAITMWKPGVLAIGGTS